MNAATYITVFLDFVHNDNPKLDQKFLEAVGDSGCKKKVLNHLENKAPPQEQANAYTES